MGVVINFWSLGESCTDFYNASTNFVRSNRQAVLLPWKHEVECAVIYDYTRTAKNRLTFKKRASYIYDGRTAILQLLHFIYFFSTNISTKYFKHTAHSPYFSSKCRLFPNYTCLVHVLFTFYVQGVLKFKCKI